MTKRTILSQGPKLQILPSSSKISKTQNTWPTAEKICNLQKKSTSNDNCLRKRKSWITTWVTKKWKSSLCLNGTLSRRNDECGPKNSNKKMWLSQGTQNFLKNYWYFWHFKSFTIDTWRKLRLFKNSSGWSTVRSLFAKLSENDRNNSCLQSG